MAGSTHAKQDMFPRPVTQISKGKKRLKRKTPNYIIIPSVLGGSTSLSKSLRVRVWVSPVRLMTKSQCKGTQHSTTRSLLISRHSESCALFKESPGRFKNPSSTDRSVKHSEKTLTCLHLVREPKKPGFMVLRIYSQILSLEWKFERT